jgi:hypothetical protein
VRRSATEVQVQNRDPSAQYIRGWGTFKMKKGFTMFYNWRRPGHISKECPGRGPICICCKIVGHEVRIVQE